MLDPQIRFYDDRDYHEIQVVEQTILNFFSSEHDEVDFEEPLSGRFIPQQTTDEVHAIVTMSMREFQALRMVIKDMLDGGSRCVASVGTLDALASLELKIR